VLLRSLVRPPSKTNEKFEQSKVSWNYLKTRNVLSEEFVCHFVIVVVLKCDSVLLLFDPHRMLDIGLLDLGISAVVTSLTVIELESKRSSHSCLLDSFSLCIAFIPIL
jgi:hypothetical protein